MGSHDTESVGDTYFEQAPVGGIVLDEDGVIVDANPAACGLLGSSRAGLRGASVDDLVVGAEAADLGAPEGAETETRLRHADGGAVDVLLDATRLDDGRALACVRDISERATYERRLRETEARYRSMTNALDTFEVGTFILDNEFSVV